MPGETSWEPDATSRRGLRSFSRRVADLYEAAGGGFYPAVLNEFLSTLVPFEDITVFCQRESEPPQLLWSSFGDAVLRSGVRNYLEATYVIDPFVWSLRAGAPPGAYRAVDVAKRARVSERHYRSLPLQQSHGEELGFRTLDWPSHLAELQIVFPIEEEGRQARACCQVGLYRRPADFGRFTPAEAAVLTDVTPLVCGTLSHHWGRLTDGGLRVVNIALKRLSARERDVIDLVAQGFTSRAIGDLLSITLETVKTHRKRAYRKLGICSQAELFALLREEPRGLDVGRR